MNLKSRLDKLETKAAADTLPVVIRLGYDETTGRYFPETSEEACLRLGLDPDSKQYRLFIRFECDDDCRIE
jgi:hypothetical protein